MNRLHKILRSDSVATGGVLVLRISAGLIITPFMLSVCSADEMAIWYLLLAVSTVSQYVELGLAQNVARFVSQAWAGASIIKSEGIFKSVDAQPNYDMVAKLAFVSLIGSTLLAVLGGIVFISLFVVLGPCDNTFWEGNRVILVGFQFVNILMGIVGRSPVGVLQGMGRFRIVALIQFIAIAIQCGSGVIFLRFGFGVPGVVTSQILSNTIVLLVAIWVVSRHVRLFVARLRRQEYWDVAKIVWPSTWKMGLSGLAGNLMSQSVLLMSSRNTDSVTLASFGLLHQLTGILFGLSIMPMQVLSPKIIKIRVEGRINEFRNISASLVVWLTLGFFAFSGALIYLLPSALQLIGASVSPLGGSIALMYVVIRTLELHHCIYTMLIISGNRIPFVWLSVASCLLIYGLGYFIGKDAGFVGILSCYGIVQLAGSNWYAPYCYIKEIGGDVLGFMRTGAASPMGVLKLLF